MAVLEAYEPIERRVHDRVSDLDVAVDEIPRIAAKDPDSVQWPPEVVADGPIALARLMPAGVDVRGNATRARIVLFRKPIERRAKDTVELGELLHEILVAQVAVYLDVEPSAIDPRSTTNNPTRACGSDDAAFEAAALALGQTAPDAEALVMRQGVVEALVTDLATQADLLGLTGGAALLREEGLRIRLRAERTVLPLVRVGRR